MIQLKVTIVPFGFPWKTIFTLMTENSILKDFIDILSFEIKLNSQGSTIDIILKHQGSICKTLVELLKIISIKNERQNLQLLQRKCQLIKANLQLQSIVLEVLSYSKNLLKMLNYHIRIFKTGPLKNKRLSFNLIIQSNRQFKQLKLMINASYKIKELTEQ